MKGIEHIIKIVLDLRNLNTNMKNMDNVFPLARGEGGGGGGWLGEDLTVKVKDLFKCQLSVNQTKVLSKFLTVLIGNNFYSCFEDFLPFVCQVTIFHNSLNSIPIAKQNAKIAVKRNTSTSRR